MSDHKTTIVPLEAWSYHSPRLARAGQRIDLGGLAEALVYYDNVLVNLQHPRELQHLAERFAAEGRVDLLIDLFKQGTLRAAHFAFHSAPVRLESGQYTLVNLQSEDQAEGSSLDLMVLNRADLVRAIPHARHRRNLLKAVRDSVVEIKASEFGAGLDNARADLEDPDRAALLVQALVDDVYELLGARKPLSVVATIEESAGNRRITWSLDLAQLGAAIGEPGFGAQSPVTAAVFANRLIWLAARQKSDLFAGSPMSRLLGDKLYEVASRAGRPQQILHELQEAVEFPDVRSLVNELSFPLDEVFKLRAKAGRFRQWLQTEGDRDRDAIIAYHREVAKEAGIIQLGRKTLRLLALTSPGLVALPTAAAVTAITGDPVIGAAAAAVAGAGSKFLLDGASRLREGWTPVTFGDWAKARIESVLLKKR